MQWRWWCDWHGWWPRLPQSRNYLAGPAANCGLAFGRRPAAAGWVAAAVVDEVVGAVVGAWAHVGSRGRVGGRDVPARSGLCFWLAGWLLGAMCARAGFGARRGRGGLAMTAVLLRALCKALVLGCLCVWGWID